MTDGPSRAGTSTTWQIGPGVGGLILHTPSELNGHQIEISPSGAQGAPRSLAEVRERPVDAGTGYAAIYPGLPAGRYTIWRDRGTAAGTVMIPGGKVSRYDWSF